MTQSQHSDAQSVGPTPSQHPAEHHPLTRKDSETFGAGPSRGGEGDPLASPLMSMAPPTSIARSTSPRQTFRAPTASATSPGRNGTSNGHSHGSSSPEVERRGSVSAASVASEGKPKIKRTRVRTGCLQCKRRRVRCDEEGHPNLDDNGQGGQCGACRRLGLRCMWDTPDDGTFPRRRVKRKTNDGSKCRACQLNSLECSKERPECGGCLIKGIPCVYEADGDVPIITHPPSTPLSRYAAVMSQVGNARLIKELINAYFVDVYPCTIFSFLHRATFVKAVEDESVSLCLLLAVCAISAKFVLTDAAPAQKWIAEAKRQAMMEIENGRMTSATLGSLVICFHFDLYARDLVAAWMTSGSAIRLAFALRLNTFDPNSQESQKSRLSWFEIESRRRLMWAVYMIDLYVSDGFSEYTNIPHSAMRIPLPVDEEAFESGEEYDAGRLILPDLAIDGTWTSPPLHQRTAQSPLCQYICAFAIRTKILSYVRNLSSDTSLPWEDRSTSWKCRRSLQWWEDNLPPQLEIEKRRMPFPIHSAQITALFTLHVWHYISYCDLCRITIFAFVEAARPEVLLAAPNSYIQAAQDECVDYAAKLLRMCQLVLDHCPTFVSRDPYISICFYQAIRITLWDLYRHPSPSAEMKRAVVALCKPAFVHLQAMEGLFPYSGSLLHDTLRLFRRYGLGEQLEIGLPAAILRALNNGSLSGDRRARQPKNFLDESHPPSSHSSPKPFDRDHAATDLLRPPFHSSKDNRIAQESELSFSSPDNAPGISPGSGSWNAFSDSWAQQQTVPSIDAATQPPTSSGLTPHPSQTLLADPFGPLADPESLWSIAGDFNSMTTLGPLDSAWPLNAYNGSLDQFFES